MENYLTFSLANKISPGWRDELKFINKFWWTKNKNDNRSEYK